MQKKTFVTVCLACYFGVSFAWTEQFSVRQYLDSVVETHPSVMAASAELRAADLDVRGAYMQMFPEVQVTSARPINRDIDEVSQPKWTLAIEQKLWAGGKMSAAIDVAQSTRSVAQAALDEARLTVALEVIEALQAFRMAKERVRIGQEVEQRLTRFESLMKRRVEVEMSAPIDAVLVSSRLLQARVDQANAETALRLATTKLEQLNYAGLAIAWDQIAVQDLGEALDMRLQDAGYEQWRSLGDRVDDHPAIRRSLHEVDVARGREALAAADRFPLIYLRLEQSRYDNPSFAAQNGETNGFVGLRFTPGAGYVSLAQARATSERVQGVEQKYQVVKQEVLSQLRQDWEAWRNAMDRMAGQTDVEKNSSLISGSYERQFVVGRISWQQTLDSVREYAQASLSLAELKAVLWGASYRLQIKTGDYELAAL